MVMRSFPSDENFWTKLSELSVTQMKPSRSIRIPCASLYGTSPHDFTKLPSGLKMKNDGTIRRKTTIWPSRLVATCDGAPQFAPAGNCPHEGRTSQLAFGGGVLDWAKTQRHRDTEAQIIRNRRIMTVTLLLASGPPFT